MLDSLVAFADFGDLVAVTSGPGLTIERDGAFAAALPDDDRQDLTRRAAEALLAEIGGTGAGLSIELTKSLPVAAGIGGGSADAAAMLRAIMTFLDRTVAPDRLRRLALELGADVPVCVAGGPAIMRGIGDELTPITGFPALGLLLVNPRRSLSTGAVFGNFTRRGADFSDVLVEPPVSFSDAQALLEFLAGQTNDLTEAAVEAMPEIGDMLAVLADLDECGLVRMSGSGATCFGLFDSAQSADKARADLQKSHPGWWSAAGQLLRQAPVPVCH